MANHPHFRVVALTATPGRTPEKVQEIVDNLHISHIEIREAESPEISRYMFKKANLDRFCVGINRYLSFDLFHVEHLSSQDHNGRRDHRNNRHMGSVHEGTGVLLEYRLTLNLIRSSP